jgi:signal transduction histidine kinase
MGPSVALKSRNRNESTRQPTFLWQGTLIVLPVVLLAAVGLYSLRQDRILAQHEAEERARDLAESLVENLWTELTQPASANVPIFPFFRVDAGGQLLSPAPVQKVPEPHPFELDPLSEAQRELWQTGMPPDLDANSRTRAIVACRAFLATRPPDGLAAACQFHLGTLLARDGDSEGAARAFQLLIDRYPGSRGETGLPLAPLGSLKLLELEEAHPHGRDAPSILATRIELVYSNAVQEPSALTPLLLDRAAQSAQGSQTNLVSHWQEEWDRQQWARELFASARDQFVSSRSNSRSAAPPEGSKFPAMFWINAPKRETQMVPAGHSTRSPAQKPRLNPVWEPGLEPVVPMTPLASNALLDERSPTRLQGAPASQGGTSFLLVRHEDPWLAVRMQVGAGGAEYQCRSLFNVTSLFRRPLPPLHPLWSATLISSTTQRDFPFLRQGMAPTTELAKILARLPAYFDLSVEVAGKTILPGFSLYAIPYHGGSNGRSRHRTMDKRSPSIPPAVLASATKRIEGVGWLQINVHLTRPEMVFARQRRRTVWFGLLIGASALAALIGFVSARRAFQNQRRLAELKSNFVSSVSHELRAPIASVRLLAEGLEQGKVAEPVRQREYYRFIVQECRRLSSMIENVLNFSRIEQGRQQYEFEPTDLGRLVEETVKLMEPTAAERQVRLQIEPFPATHTQPTLDGQALQQALINLLDNAIKHSPPGQSVTVSVGSPSKPGETNVAEDTPASRAEEGGLMPAAGESAPKWIMLTVADHGPGIPTEDRERIFERFYRRGSELRRETPGVGIGLNIVKHIVQAHGGRVWVESEVGKGSQFIMALPVDATGTASHS